MRRALPAALLTCLALAAAHTRAQEPTEAPPIEGPPTVLTVRSNLVVVPAMVKTKAGERVFSLTANDFHLTDDGVPQQLTLEPDTDALPLALVVVVQTGGAGGAHLHDYDRMNALLDAVVGSVKHRVAVVSFDSEPFLNLPFSNSTDKAAGVVNMLEPGDDRAATLDALRFAIDLLSKQPTTYRRAILLLSETLDNDSRTTLDEAIRAVNDTNTAIYSFGFSSTKASVKHEASKLPNGSYSREPYPPGGCFAKDADPDAHGSKGKQALDCASDLLPPLRLARLAFIAARDSLKRNVPETVAELTGGEYFSFKDDRSLSRDLVTVSNDVPNHYILSFRPQSPHPGLHALALSLPERPDLKLQARKAYWIDEPADTPAKP